MGNCCKRQAAPAANSGNGTNANMVDGEKQTKQQGTSAPVEDSLIRSVLTKADFDQQLKDAGDKLVVVDFYATWCGPCKQISPKLELMVEEFPDVVFIKVDVDENEEVANQFSVSSMPTFLFFKSGSKLKDFIGSNADKLKEIINQCK